MLLEKLEIFGFKSFAEKTTISFANDATAIVGPNGCGKSNILDALKWSLGDRSLRSLRGEKMEDIVFSGSDHKNASNYAQVSITLNNKERIIHVDADKVHICRRYYRDGQSQVLLNQNKSTLKELEDILLDTGLGKSCYSFMEQGKIDMILSSKPEERRYIFEEAAGVSRFKQQQEEVMKKLESTEVNIVRLKDILHKTNEELKVRQLQAKTAEQHKELKSLLDIQQTKIKYITVKEIDKKISLLKMKVSQKKGNIEKNRQKEILFTEKIENNTKEKESLLKELYQKETLIQLDQDKIQQCKKAIDEAKLRNQVLQSDQERLQANINDIAKRMNTIKIKESQIKQMHFELKEEIGEKIKLKLSLDQQINLQEKTIKNLEKEKALFSTLQNEKNRELKKLRTELSPLAKEVLSALRVEKNKWIKNQQLQEIKKKKFLVVVQTLFAYLEKLNEGNKQKLEHFLAKYSYSSWVKIINELSDSDKNIKNFFFSDQSVFSLKEGLDETISLFEKELENILQKIQTIDKELSQERGQLAQNSRELQHLMEEIKIGKLKKENSSKENQSLKEQMQHEKDQSASFRKLHQNTEKRIVELMQEQKQNHKEMSLFKNKISSDEKSMIMNRKKLDGIHILQNEALFRVTDIQKNNGITMCEIGDFEIKIGTLQGNRESIILDIYHEYEMSFEELEKKFSSECINEEKVKLARAKTQQEIRTLGTINYLAIDEMQYLTKEQKSLDEQLEDIIQAKNQNLLLVQDIMIESEKRFLSTFELIKKNFQKTFQTLFNGGETVLLLTQRDKPLQSGIDIHVQMPGKNKKTIRLLSGGEKALTAIALMFAVYMVRSSPICVLDEIDASLDDQNVRKLMDLLQNFKKKTQFILITHNKITMSQSSFLFGITMQEAGVSQVLEVSLQSSA